MGIHDNEVEAVRERLIACGPEKLANVLLQLANWNSDAHDMVERLAASREDNRKRGKTRLNKIKRGKRFYDWRATSEFAHELKAVVEDIAAAEPDPEEGFEAMCEFLECDKSIIERCDDSNGQVSWVFRYDATQLLTKYAADCADKEKTGARVVDLYAGCEYGVREDVVESVAKVMSEPVCRSMIGQLWRMADDAEGEYAEFKKRHLLRGVEEIARLLKDAPLFEKARLATVPADNTAANIDIARAYLEAGQPAAALSWVSGVPDNEQFEAWKRRSLLFEIYGQLGDQENLTAIAWEIFRNGRCVENFVQLLGVIGEESRDSTLASEIQLILNTEHLYFPYSDAQFLIEMDQTDALATLVRQHASKLDGDLYLHVLPIAEHLKQKQHWSTASLAYRALLDSILARAQSKYYHHGVRYLRELDAISGDVDDWNGFPAHGEYMEELRSAHGRKYRFWQLYGKK